MGVTHASRGFLSGGGLALASEACDGATLTTDSARSGFGSVFSSPSVQREGAPITACTVPASHCDSPRVYSTCQPLRLTVCTVPVSHCDSPCV